MVTVHQTVLTLLILQIYVSAAPSDITKLEDTTKIENEEPKLDASSTSVKSKDGGNSTEVQRQKRFYNYYGYGFPPISPVQYPTHNKRDQASDLGVYGIDDPLSQIQRRLHDIASVVRQSPTPSPPPAPAHIPLFFPVIFIPQFGCACNSDFDTTTQSTPKPNTSRPTPAPPVDGITTSPDIVNRWPEMEDERQNWGLVVNETEEDYFGEDFSRPISFDPIELNTSMLRPAPPVDHGSSQAGTQNGGQSTTTVRPGPSSNDVTRPPGNNRPRPPGNNTPRPPSNNMPRPPSNNMPSPPVAAGAASFASSGPYPPSSSETPREVPTTCDGAVLSCCHQAQVTYDCFAVLGCPDPTSYGNPCDPLVILRVITKYQKFYGVRNG